MLATACPKGRLWNWLSLHPAFVKCWHLLWLLTSEQEQTKLLKLLSVPKPINSNHLCEIYLQLSKEITLFLGINNLLPNWKVSMCCFEELKMLCHLSHSPVLFHDPYLGDLDNSYKNRSPLRKKLTYPQVVWYCNQTQARSSLPALFPRNGYSHSNHIRFLV